MRFINFVLLLSTVLVIGACAKKMEAVAAVAAAVAQTVQAAVLLTPVPPPHQVYL